LSALWANIRSLKIFHVSQFAYAFVFLPLIFSIGSIEFDPTSLLRLDQQSQAQVFAKEASVPNDGPTFSIENQMTEVTLVQDEKKVTFLTRATKLADALLEQNLKFPGHLLVPGPETRLVGSPLVVRVESGATALVYDGEKVFEVETINTDLRKIALDAGLAVYPEDKVYAQTLDEEMKIKVRIERATPVRLRDAGVDKIVRTWSKTVGELMAEKGITLQGQDTLSASFDTAVVPGMLIEITRFSDQIVKETQEISAWDEYQNDNSMNRGESAVVQEGRNGSKEVTLKVLYRNNVEISREVLEEKILSEAVPRIVKVGTKINTPGYVWSGNAYDPLYQRAGAAFGVPWQILSAIHAVETGRDGDTCRGSAWNGMGPMQFLPSTWWAHAQDGDGDGDRDICSVADAVFGASHLLAGGSIRDAVYRYNHSWYYVDLVFSIARELGWNG